MACAFLSLALRAQTQIPVGAFPMSTVVTPDAKYLLVLNTGQPRAISVIDLGTSKELSRAPVQDAWQGLAITKAGDKVYVGGGASAAVLEFTFANGTLTAGRTFPIVAAKDRTPQDFAGDVRFAPDGHLLYVTNVFRDTVVVMNPQSGYILSKIKTGRRPYRILFHPSGKTMYVSSWADGSIGQYDVNSGERVGNFRVAPHPTDMIWLDGALPVGAESHPEVKARVFVTAANTNSLYELGANETGELTRLETISLALTQRQPLGTTPSALASSADKKMVYVACSGVNGVAVIDITGERNLVKGFIPTGAYPTAVLGLPAGIGILNGRGNSVQLIEQADEEKRMAAFQNPYQDEMLDTPAPPEGNPIHAGGPIKHVIYVVRGDDHGVLTAGMENDFLARLGDRFARDNSPPDPADVPPAGYLWNAATQAGLKIRNYGFQVHNLPKPNADGEQIDRTFDPALTADNTDMEYRGPDPAYPDTERAKEFASEMKEFDTLTEMPQLLLVRIGTDDQALRIIEDALSKSKFRNETAMFIAGAGGSVISPWAKNGPPDPGRYDALSALRTTEIILGLRPMTIFDAAAKPLFDAFANTPVPAQ